MDDEWMDGKIGGWMDGWMSRWTDDGWMEGLEDGQMDGWVDGPGAERGLRTGCQGLWAPCQAVKMP